MINNNNVIVIVNNILTITIIIIIIIITNIISAFPIPTNQAFCLWVRGEGTGVKIFICPVFIQHYLNISPLILTPYPMIVQKTNTRQVAAIASQRKGAHLTHLDTP